MVVEDVHAVHSEAGPRAVEVNFDGTMSNRNHPEYVVAVNMHVVIVNLVRELSRSNWTGVEVKSNKGESASMLLAVRADELSQTKSHVRLERQP